MFLIYMWLKARLFGCALRTQRTHTYTHSHRHTHSAKLTLALEHRRIYVMIGLARLTNRRINNKCTVLLLWSMFVAILGVVCTLYICTVLYNWSKVLSVCLCVYMFGINIYICLVPLMFVRQLDKNLQKIKKI